MPDETDRQPGGMSTRDMLVIQGEQLRTLRDGLERLSASLEQRLGQGDRRFAEVDARLNNTDARFASTNSAINTLSGRIVDLERALRDEVLARRASDEARAKAEREAESARERLEQDWNTWKIRAQTIAAVVAGAWGLFQFVLPYIINR